MIKKKGKQIFITCLTLVLLISNINGLSVIGAVDSEFDLAEGIAGSDLAHGDSGLMFKVENGSDEWTSDLGALLSEENIELDENQIEFDSSGDFEFLSFDGDLDFRDDEDTIEIDLGDENDLDIEDNSYDKEENGVSLEEEVLPEVGETLSFYCPAGEVCQWEEDIIDQHTDYVIPVHLDNSLYRYDETDYRYISIEAFEEANPRLARSNWISSANGNLTISGAGIFRTNGFNRNGSVTISSGATLVVTGSTVITGPVIVQDGGHLILESGTIQYTSGASTSTGIAVFLPGNNSLFDMSDGLIRGRVRIGANDTAEGGVFNLSGTGIVDSGNFRHGIDDTNASGQPFSVVRDHQASIEIGALGLSGVTGGTGHYARGILTVSGEALITGTRSRAVSVGGRNAKAYIRGGVGSREINLIKDQEYSQDFLRKC
jgi:hypothetical protein